MILRIILSIALLWGMVGQTFAQSLLIDRGVKINGLWCFPLATDTSSYLYLTDKAQLSVSPAGLPEFSSLRYVINTEGSDDASEVISKAAGGAIIHFLVTYQTDEKKVRIAEAGLRQNLGNENIKLKGPVIFEEAHYALVSSILTEGKEEKKLLTVGNAPVLEGGKLAFSFHLTPEDSKLLQESFKMATPDISLMFDFTFSGFSEAYDAEMVVDWSRVYNYEKIKSSGGFLIFSYDVEKTTEELFQHNAIQLIVQGEDEVTDRLVEMAYQKATDMLFQPIDINQYRDNQGAWMNQILSAFDHVVGRFLPVSQGFQAGYTLRKIRMNGQSRLSFNKRLATQRHHFVTFNIGDLYKKYGEDERLFKTVNLFDPDFQQREVYIGLDGQLTAAFGRMVNNVTVNLKKIHGDGTETLEQRLVRRDSLGQGTKGFVYGNRKDYDRAAWLNYAYQTQWHFQGGGELQTPWQETDAAMIDLFVPYDYRTIYLDGELDPLWKAGIRTIIVELEYDFFGKMVNQRQTIRKGDQLSDKTFELTMPAGQYDCRYTITWLTKEGAISRPGTDNYGVIFLDQLPE